jgi:hypothetical protein
MKTFHTFPSRAFYMSCPFLPPWFDHSINIPLVKIMNLLITQFSPASCYLVPLRSKCSPQDPVLRYQGRKKHVYLNSTVIFAVNIGLCRVNIL